MSIQCSLRGGRSRRKADGHKAVDILRAIGLGLRLEPLGMPTLEEMAQRFGGDGREDD